MAQSNQSVTEHSVKGAGPHRFRSFFAVFLAVPILFFLITEAEFLREVWSYSTLKNAVTAGARFAACHGIGGVSDREDRSNGPMTVGDVAKAVADGMPAGDAGKVAVILKSATAEPVVCAPVKKCLGDRRQWPVANDNAPGLTIEVSAVYESAAPVVAHLPGRSEARVDASTWYAASKQSMGF